MEERRVVRIIKRELLIVLWCFILGFIIGIMGYIFPNQCKLRESFRGPYKLGDYCLVAGNIVFVWGYFILLPIRFIISIVKKQIKK
jgi:hypothetical protein